MFLYINAILPTIYKNAFRMNNSFVNKATGDVYAIVIYSIPPLATIPEWTSAKELNIDDMTIIVEGIKNNTIKNNVFVTMLITRDHMKNLLVTYEKEKEYFEETGMWSSRFKHLDDQVSIEMLYNIIRSMGEMIEGIEHYVERAAGTMIPQYIQHVENLIKDPDIYKSTRAIQYSSLIHMKGQALYDMKHLMESHDVYRYNVSFQHMILSKFLQFYVEHYDLRKKYFGTIQPIIIQPEHILVTTDATLKVIIEVVCPELLVKKNNNFILGFDLGILLKENGLGINLNDEHVTDIEVPDIDPFEGGTLEEGPEHSQAVYRLLWLNEVKSLMPIIFRLSVINKEDTNEKVGRLADTVLVLIEEGVILSKVKAELLVSSIFEESIPILEDIVYIMLSGEDDENVKADFSIDAQKIIECVNRYVSDE
jgi:hypothetical protein